MQVSDLTARLEDAAGQRTAVESALGKTQSSLSNLLSSTARCSDQLSVQPSTACCHVLASAVAHVQGVVGVDAAVGNA